MNAYTIKGVKIKKVLTKKKQTPIFTETEKIKTLKLNYSLPTFVIHKYKKYFMICDVRL
jgi:hypothetical protein